MFIHMHGFYHGQYRLLYVKGSFHVMSYLDMFQVYAYTKQSMLTTQLPRLSCCIPTRESVGRSPYPPHIQGMI